MTTFGESHGLSLGCIIDGCPAGIALDAAHIQQALKRRKPGTGGASVTCRKESDLVEIQSGVFEGKTTGTPIALVIKNENQHSSDYDTIKNKFRPGHADITYFEKYGTRDWLCGGRSSGRETAARVAAGAVARQLLEPLNISITAYTKRAAGIFCATFDASEIEKNSMRAPDKNAAAQMEQKINALRLQGDSAGGIIECVVHGVPAGLGEPVFDKLDAAIAQAILSVGAVKGIEFGAGFESADMTGSQCNDEIHEFSDAAFRAARKLFSTPTPVVYLAEYRAETILCSRSSQTGDKHFERKKTIETLLSECELK